MKIEAAGVCTIGFLGAERSYGSGFDAIMPDGLVKAFARRAKTKLLLRRYGIAGGAHREL
jgi:hypothetical protein